MIRIMGFWKGAIKKIYILFSQIVYGSHECTAGFKFEDGTNPTKEKRIEKNNKNNNNIKK